MAFFFCGIGGSGMSPLAQIMASSGAAVKGSDRAYDNGQSKEKFTKLQGLGITLFPQDGSGLETGDILVVSSAVEDTIPDVKAAKALNLNIMKRAELLATLFNQAETGIAVGGTSGKSSVTAMVGHILKECGKQPDVINGAVMKNSTDGLGNVMLSKGNSGVMAIEADESDGSIALYKPAVSVLLNISEDHKSFEELYQLFGDFIAAPKLGAVINLDCPHSAKIATRAKNAKTFSLTNRNADFYAENITPTASGVTFQLKNTAYTLLVPGKHNVANALAAIAAATLVGVETHAAATAMQKFQGVKRRLETLGTSKNITVIDDFGHNPDKITAGLNTLQEHAGRLLVMFQPHGFAPTRMMKKGLIEAFVSGLKKGDMLLMPEIYYAGGTTTKDISSKDVTDAVDTGGKSAKFFNTRADVGDFVVSHAQQGDRFVIMGARDDTLTDFGYDILNRLK